MKDFEVAKQETDGGVVQLDVKGYLDAHTFEALDKAIQGCFDAGRYKIIVRLDQVGYISSAGAGVFIGAIGKAREHQGDIVLLRPSPNVREVFELLGLTQIFVVTDDPAEARKVFAAA